MAAAYRSSVLVASDVIIIGRKGKIRMPYFSSASWAQFCAQHGIDSRLSKAIPSLKIDHPTLVQDKASPAILSGRDVLIKSPTGTGKSLAYIIPMVQRLISQGSEVKPLQMIVLVPTKELASQVFGVVSSLLNYLFDTVSVDCFSGDDKYRRPSLPSIFITSPRGLVKLCTGAGAHKQAAEAVCNIKYIVIDEADLVFSQGFEKDIQEIVSSILPREYQAVLVSATLSADLEKLKGLMLREPQNIIIHDSDIEDGQSTSIAAKKAPTTTKSSLVGHKGCRQFIFPCASRDKYLCLYGLIKLEIATGRILIFTSTVDAAYRLKIFFDKFAIKSGVFNTQMPLECRNRVLTAYNDNLFSILIASSSDSTSDPEASASHRGIDFTNVGIVINFDLPESVEAYVHRAGRTARGGKSGSVVTFVDGANARETSFIQKLDSSRIEQIGITATLFETLRYRVEDVYKGISRRAIAASRQRELLTEILHNDQLKKKLSENTEEVQALRQSVRSLREHAKTKWHLQQVPEYLAPKMEGVKPLGQPNGPDVGEKLRKRIRAEELELKRGKRQRTTLREKLLKNETGITGELAPEELAPISGRKLWKIKHHKKVGRTNEDTIGKPPRIARKLWKNAKKFSV
jgi:ATP-dependent RNA helicase DDX56/DBP9